MNCTEIKKLVEAEFGLNLAVKTGKRKIAIPRGIYFNLAYEFAEDGTYQRIGNEVGYDHVTVLYWRKKLPQHLPYEPEFAHIYYKLRRNLNVSRIEETQALLMDEKATEILSQMSA
jgi:chromosomal replication initiation ATPase DnaA